MSKLKGICWECDRCGNIDNQKPWNCPVCGEEVCENCFDRYMVCKSCAKEKTDEELKNTCREAGYDYEWLED